MVTVIISLVPLTMVAVADDPHPSAIVGTIDPRVPVMISVIIVNYTSVPVMIISIVIPLLAGKRKG